MPEMRTRAKISVIAAAYKYISKQNLQMKYVLHSHNMR